MILCSTVVILIGLWSISDCATFRPNGYTFTGVSSMNGSDPNAGCPSVCRMTGISNERFCDCTGQLSDTSGTPIDGIVPTFDVRQRGTWASQLYTLDITTTSHAIGFIFSSSFILQEVTMSIFLCTAWFIPRSGLTINIHRDIVFPGFTSTTPIGSLTLTLEANCSSLETIYITTSPSRNSNIYVIEFTNSVSVGGIYIGEVIFRDEVTHSQASVTIDIESCPATSAETTTKHTTKTVTQSTTRSDLWTNTTMSKLTTAVTTNNYNYPVQNVNTNTNTISSFQHYSTTPIASKEEVYKSVNYTSTPLLIPIVSVLISIILCMAVIMTVGCIVCSIIVHKKNSLLRLHEANKDHKIEQGIDEYEDIDNFVKTVTPIKLQPNSDNQEENIELSNNQAYSLVGDIDQNV